MIIFRRKFGSYCLGCLELSFPLWSLFYLKKKQTKWDFFILIISAFAHTFVFMILLVLCLVCYFCSLKKQYSLNLVYESICTSLPLPLLNIFLKRLFRYPLSSLPTQNYHLLKMLREFTHLNSKKLYVTNSTSANKQ